MQLIRTPSSPEAGPMAGRCAMDPRCPWYWYKETTMATHGDEDNECSETEGDEEDEA